MHMFHLFFSDLIDVFRILCAAKYGCLANTKCKLVLFIRYTKSGKINSTRKLTGFCTNCVVG